MQTTSQGAPAQDSGKTKHVIALGVILAVAVMVRLIGITWGLPNKSHVTTYSTDEYTLLYLLQELDPASLDFNPDGGKHPGSMAVGTLHLYTYGALIKTLSVTGWLTLVKDKAFYYQNPDEWGKFFLAGRLLSVCYGVLTVWLIYLLAFKMYGPRTALLSALFLACMPAHVVYSRYLLSNAPGTFWVVLALYFLQNIIDLGRARDYVLAGMSAGFAFATRYSAGPLIPMIFLAHFMTRAPLKKIRLPFIGLAAFFFFFILVSPYTLLDHHNFIKGFSVVKNLASGGAAPFEFFKSAGQAAASATEALGIFLLLLCLAGTATALYRRTRADILLLCWTLPMIPIFIKAGGFATPGRMLPALPLLAVMAARALSLAWDIKPAAAKFALSAVLAHAIVFYSASFKLLHSQDIRDYASEWLAANVKPGSSIGLVTEPSWFSPGIIDRKYRHPDHLQLPAYKFTSLTSGDWKSRFGCDLLGAVRPDLVIVSDVETGFLSETVLNEKLREYDYSEIKRFTPDFSVINFKLGRKLPGMFYIPNRISVFEKGRGAAGKID